MVNGIYPIIKTTNKINSFIILIPGVVYVLSTIYGTKMCILGILAVHGVMTESFCESLGNPSWRKTTQKLDVSSSLTRYFHSLFFFIWTLVWSEACLQPAGGYCCTKNSLKFLSGVTVCLPSHTDTWRWVNVENKSFKIIWRPQKCLSTVLKVSSVFFHVLVGWINSSGVKFAHYIKMMAFALVDGVVSYLCKGYPERLCSNIIHALNLACWTWVA